MINIKKITYEPFSTKDIVLHGLKVSIPTKSKLVLEFSGKNSSTILVNTIRRVVMDNIETYAWDVKDIKITSNTSIYNNDMMKYRLSQLPIFNLKNKKDLNINMAINVHNTSETIMNVTTDTEGVRFYENDEEIKHKYKSPILLIQLKPKQQFNCSMTASLSTGEKNNIWCGASNAFYDDHTTNEITGEFIKNPTNKITLTIESQGQFTEYELVDLACSYIINKLNTILDNMKTQYNKDNQEGDVQIFKLENEDFTMGNLVNDYLQNHKNIKMSGLSKPDGVVRTVIIQCTNDKNLLVSIGEAINLCIDMYKYIQTAVNKLK